MSSRSVFIFIALGAVASAVAYQDLSPAPKAAGAPKLGPIDYTKGVHLESNVGSFKIKRGGEDLDDGVLDISFKGTILVSGLIGEATPTAPAVQETGTGQMQKDLQTWNKRLFHSAGVGKLHVKGKFDGIQFFGQDVSAYYRGTGVIQLYGEFDKNLNTGSYWYDETPKDKGFWGTGGAIITPRPRPDATGVGNIKIKNITPKG
ncbi:MAG TPA: hypothetical protein VG944_06430 [Fimbriimonas sp.]|nr:hypothetical protein [Fimbriimonas sp.]